ncbi:MAG: hypothetical protein KGI90_09200 [Burkholderiales bacterium]|nr:hypothetical protein [Burkholderiales bacterium]
MTQQAAVRNPFMLMISPEIVLAAVEQSERLSQLSRHLCRPLDRVGPPGTGALASGGSDGEADIDGTRAIGADDTDALSSAN